MTGSEARKRGLVEHHDAGAALKLIDGEPGKALARAPGGKLVAWAGQKIASHHRGDCSQEDCAGGRRVEGRSRRDASWRWPRARRKTDSRARPPLQDRRPERGWHFSGQERAPSAVRKGRVAGLNEAATPSRTRRGVGQKNRRCCPGRVRIGQANPRRSTPNWRSRPR